MTNRTVSKALITHEDFALGQGSTSQTRQGVSTSVTQVDLPWILTTLVEIRRLDTSKYFHCTYDSGTGIHLYKYDASSNETVDDYNYIAPNEGVGQWVRVKGWSTAIDDNALAVDSVQALYEGDWSAYSHLSTRAYATGGTLGGAKWYKGNSGGTPTTSGTLSTDLALGYVIDAAGNYWHLCDDQELYAEMFGCVGDNSTDDESAFLVGLAVGPINLSPGKTYYVSNMTLPANCTIIFNGSTIRGGLVANSTKYTLIGPGTVSSNEGDSRPFTGHLAANHFCSDIVYSYTGSTGVEAVCYFAPTSSHVVDNIHMVRPIVRTTAPTAAANTRGLKFHNRENTHAGRCQNIRVIDPKVVDCPSMGIEVVSEWTYGGATLGHDNVKIIRPVIDNCGQNAGSVSSKIGLSYAGWGRAECISPLFKNANGKNWEFVSQNGSLMQDCTIEDVAATFNVFSTSAPGAAPSAVNIKCKIDGVKVINGNSELMQIAGFEDGEISNIDAADSSRLDLGCFNSRIHDNNVKASNTSTIACRVTGGNNKIFDNTFDISEIGASGDAALRFFGASAEDNTAWDNTLIHDSAANAWDETSGAADNIVRSYIDGDAVVHDVNYVAYTMSDADENLSKAAQHADVLRIAGSLTATRTLTFTLAKNQDLKIWNATGQSITVGYTAGTTVTIASGDVVHVMGNTGGMWELS